MPRLIGPNTWDVLTELDKSLTPQDKLHIDSLCQQKQRKELVDFINQKIHQTKKAHERYQKLDPDLDADGLMFFYDKSNNDSLTTRAYNFVIKSLYIDDKTQQNMTALLKKLNQDELVELQKLANNLPINMGLKWLEWGVLSLLKLTPFLLIGIIRSLGINYFELPSFALPNPENDKKDAFKNGLNALAHQYKCPLHVTDLNLKAAQYSIPKAEEPPDDSFFGKFKNSAGGGLFPAPVRWQTTWQKILFALIFLALLAWLILNPPSFLVGLFAASASLAGTIGLPVLGPILIVFSKMMGAAPLALFINWLANKIAFWKIVSSSDNAPFTDLVSHQVATRTLRKEDLPSSTHQMTNSLGQGPTASPHSPAHTSTSSPLFTNTSSSSSSTPTPRKQS